MADEVDICFSSNNIKLFKALAHEIRHAFQYEKGLFDDGGIWAGKDDSLTYDDLPWEIDACEYQEDAFNRLFKEIR
jgi:hypothetical protein